MVRAVLFDLDGTLCNTLNSIAYFGNKALEDNGYKACCVESYRQMVCNGRDKLIERMIVNSLGQFDESAYNTVGAEYDELYAQKPAFLVEAYNGIPELLKYLKENEIKAAIISNKPDDMTVAVASEVLGAEYFEIIQGARKDFPKKPDPTAPLDILKRLGVNAEDTLYVGDSRVDMLTGKNAGMKSIGCSWGFRGTEELKQNGADFIVNYALEIIDIIKEESK